MNSQQRNELVEIIARIAYTSVLNIEIFGHPDQEFVLDQWAQSADYAAVRDAVSLGGQVPDWAGIRVRERWEEAIGDMIEEAVRFHPGIKEAVVEHLLSLLPGNQPNRRAALDGLSKICPIGDVETRIAFLLDELSSLTDDEGASLVAVLGSEQTAASRAYLKTMQERIPGDWTMSRDEINIYL